MKKFKTLGLILLLITAINARSQFGDFQVTQCSDSLEVVDLFKEYFFENYNFQQIKNLTFVGDPSAVGYFENGYFLDFEKGNGIILSTGKAGDANESNICETGANASTHNDAPVHDPDLDIILYGQSSIDVCIIEFDFKPLNGKVGLDYVFASEEYHDFVMEFNDCAGIFLSGPGIGGPFTNSAKNIALVNNEHIGISTINIGKGDKTCLDLPNECHNCEYLIDNSLDSSPAFDKLAYDAYTLKIKAEQIGLEREMYHMKIAICDYGDGVYDSAIFLEAGGFRTGGLAHKIDGHKIIK